MAKQLPTRWETSDGRKFAEESDAEDHEDFIKAQRHYEEAQRTFARMVWASQKTADGEPFELSMRTYWYVWEPFNSMPELRQVSFYVWHLSFDDDDHGSILSPREENGRQSEGYTRYKIKDLYRHEKNARAALREAAKKQLAHFSERIAKMET